MNDVVAREIALFLKSISLNLGRMATAQEELVRMLKKPIKTSKAYE